MVIKLPRSRESTPVAVTPPSTTLARVRASSILRPAIRLLGDPRLPSFQEKADAILRGDGSTIAAGHPVLGCPVGTDAHVEQVIRASAKKAAALIPILDRLLLSKDAGSYAPDERDLLIRLCVWPRLRHLLRTVRPGLGDATFRDFDALIMNARLLPLRQPGALPLTHLHIDPFFLAALPGRFGGHGTLLHVNIDPQDPSASHHDVAYYGSMAAVWHYIRAWVAFDRLMISFREVGLTPNRDLLPINSQFPQLHSRLDDGRLSPASVPLGAAGPFVILTIHLTPLRSFTTWIALMLLATHTRSAQPRQW